MDISVNEAIETVIEIIGGVFVIGLLSFPVLGNHITAIMGSLL